MNWVNLINESIYSEENKHNHSEEEEANLFKAFDGGSTEIEVLNLFHNLILVLKPNLILETGTLYGYGSIAIGSALKENSRGKLITLENNKETFDIAKNNINRCNLKEYIEILNIDSLKYIDSLKQNNKFDFVFFDSSTTIRIEEFNRLNNKKALNNLIAFHDTSKIREKTFESDCQDKYVKDLDAIEQKYCKGSIEFYLSRGFRLMQLKRENNG